MSKLADLHMHTHISTDGQYTPHEIIQIAKEKKLKYIAVADHDSTQAVQETIEIGQKNGITVIPATELNCHFNGVHLHILGYGIDINNQALKDYEQYILKQDQDNTLKQIQAIEDLGIIVNREKAFSLAKYNIVIPEMIAEVALEDPQNSDHPLLKPYRKGGPRSDNPQVNFYWDLCAQGKPAHIPATYATLSEAIKMINDANGIAIFAHPGNNIKQDKQLALDIYNQGLVGLEVYTSYHDKSTTKFYEQLAKELNCLVTVGSDFHGKTKPAIQMGMVKFPNEQQQLNKFLQALNYPLEKITIETTIHQPIENVWAALHLDEFKKQWKTITNQQAPTQLNGILKDNREVIILIDRLSDNETIVIISFEPRVNITYPYQTRMMKKQLQHLKEASEKLTHR